jgi:U6 snRNA-associated Sm-like protein LSm7
MAKKESALDLAKFIDKGVRVKLAGGREGAKAQATLLNAIMLNNLTLAASAVSGTLKGYDQLMNLVLDESMEYLRGDPGV